MQHKALFFGLFTAATLAVPTFAADGAPEMFGHLLRAQDPGEHTRPQGRQLKADPARQMSSCKKPRNELVNLASNHCAV